VLVLTTYYVLFIHWDVYVSRSVCTMGPVCFMCVHVGQ
jgi:hypothetical protein